MLQCLHVLANGKHELIKRHKAIEASRHTFWLGSQQVGTPNHVGQVNQVVDSLRSVEVCLPSNLQFKNLSVEVLFLLVALHKPWRSDGADFAESFEALFDAVLLSNIDCLVSQV